ncbi:hypothetical protein AGLY_000593 [Aphis glycines]|uniref:Uncharacterized protein n=1 Tax=Aphis glycines TaxID=307491 RepID=A0A6G0U8G1_APHGL|nr:hypothetical protein AGLY_000593 [Aphis glycines]
MKTIRNKGHRVGNVANDDLYQKEKRRQPKHGDEAAFFSTVSTHFKLICKKITILITVDDCIYKSQKIYKLDSSSNKMFKKCLNVLSYFKFYKQNKFIPRLYKYLINICSIIVVIQNLKKLKITIKNSKNFSLIFENIFNNVMPFQIIEYLQTVFHNSIKRDNIQLIDITLSVSKKISFLTSTNTGSYTNYYHNSLLHNTAWYTTDSYSKISIIEVGWLVNVVVTINTEKTEYKYTTNH